MAEDVMFPLYKLAGAFAAPPGLFCILLVFCALLALRAPRRRALALLLSLLSLSLWYMSTTTGAALITGTLEETYADRLPAFGAHTAVLVLSGGSSYNSAGDAVQPGVYTMERVSRGMLLAKKLGCPLILSGGNVYGFQDRTEAEIMAEWAGAMGFSGRMILEKASRTTKENLKYSAPIMAKEGISRLVLVTDAFHMPRSVSCARRYIPEAEIYPYASVRVTDPKFRGLPSLLPTSGSLFDSCMGIREWIGLAAYRMLPR